MSRASLPLRLPAVIGASLSQRGPAVSRTSLRLRLTALYGGLLLLAMALVLGASYWLVGRHLDRTLPAVDASAALQQLGVQYALALAGATLLAGGVGWLFAGRQLAPMERAFAAQERFVANASHELRSPLTVIRTEAEVALADPQADPRELREMGEVVIEAADRMDELLDGLMELARGSRLVARGEPVDLARLVRRPAGTPPGRRVRLQLDLEAARTRGDARLLERLAGNLIDNGLRYNHAGGHVDVRTGEADGKALLRVSNSGPRMDPAGVARLLEPFERGGRTVEPGAGLGLSIVRTIAEAHGGAVELRAREAGGLDVEVALPRA